MTNFMEGITSSEHTDHLTEFVILISSNSYHTKTLILPYSIIIMSYILSFLTEAQI